jgi:hypothetical protein
MLTNEKAIRAYANHLALIIHRRGMRLELHERYDDDGQSKRLIGVYRSWRAVEQAIKDYERSSARGRALVQLL